MLIAFSIENYRSFKERATLSMVAAELRSRPPQLDTNNLFTARDDLQLLTSAVIYGANASGKSNLVAGLGFMRDLVLNSSRETRLHDPIPVQPYTLSSTTEDQPSRFEVVFVVQGVIYRYGFLVSRKQIDEEWLYYARDKKEGYMFRRTLDSIEVNRRSFKEGLGLEERTRSNALFLSVAAQWNGPQAGQLSAWFEQLAIDYGIEGRKTRQLIAQFEQSDMQREIISFIKELDLGIDNITLEQGDTSVERRGENGQTVLLPLLGSSRIRTLHTKYDQAGEPVASEPFDLFVHESQGTRRLFTLAEPILSALRHGHVLVIDELDARMHPLLTAAIVRLFHNPAQNPKHGQLIFTTHDSNLLAGQLFRRDQIWFVEKSRRGESSLYSLADYKVRNDAAYEKNYLTGRYGAIPYLSELSVAVGVENGKQEEHNEVAQTKALSD
jgi:uncharacterized protein